jgi:hypothetical protein
MKYKHYAPKAAMYSDRRTGGRLGELVRAVQLAMATGSKIGVVAAASTIAQLPASSAADLPQLGEHSAGHGREAFYLFASF